jgi:small-conductance mechanosensitive channel
MVGAIGNSMTLLVYLLLAGSSIAPVVQPQEAADAGSVDARTDAGAPVPNTVAPPVHAPAAAPLPEEAPPVPTAAAVTFGGEDLFVIRDPIGHLSPGERAAAIKARLHAIVVRSASVVATLRLEQRPDATDVYAGKDFLLTVSQADAASAGMTRASLAAKYQQLLSTTLEHEFRARSIPGLLRGLGESAVATLLFGLLVALLVAGQHGATRRLRAAVGVRIRGVRIQKVELISAERTVALLGGFLASVRTLLIVVAAGAWASVTLGFFPWTRDAAHAIFERSFGALSWLGDGVLSYLPNLVYIALIVITTRWVLRIARFVFDQLDRGPLQIEGFYSDWSDPTYKIVRFLLLALAAVVVFPYLPGAESSAFKGVSLFVGVLFSLGSSSAMSNIVAGVALTYMRPFVLGDRVQIADTVGDVIENSLLVVRVKTIKNVEVTIPNAAVLSGHIINYSAAARSGGLLLHTTVTIGYDAPWRTIHDLLIEAACATDGLLTDPRPFVLQTSLDDFFVSYQINATTDRPQEMAGTYGRLHQSIQDKFNAAGVEIMSPHFAAVRDGNSVTTPSGKRPAGYAAPPFVVRVDDGSGRR